MSRVGICECGAPLISTFMFNGAEYFCIECGAHYGMFDVEKEEETPELKKRLQRNKKKWDKVSKGLLTGGVMFRWCDKCGDETHIEHATAEELEAHRKALKDLDKILNPELIGGK